jgi:UDP-N-acetylglucosamine enolpyruvyl transferase
VIEWKSPIDVSCLTNTFSEFGISTTSEADKISVSVDSASRENKFDVVADVYPGFPTDAIPLVVAATIKSGRQVRFYDKVFRGRNNYLQEFVKLGAKVIIVSDREFIVDGVTSLVSNDVSANDIRGSTSLLLAAIQTENLSRIKNAHQIARGYEHLPLELREKGFNVHVKNLEFNSMDGRAQLLM